jgi:hypothetical protein
MTNITTADEQTDKIKCAYTALTVLIIWFALVLQFTISLSAYQANGRTLSGTIIQLFSFFTILCNLLAVVSLTVLLVRPQSVSGRFFAKDSVLGAIVLYITVVGLVYNIVLRHLQHLQGLFKLADELLHTVNPLLFIIYWVAFARKGGLKWANAFTWLWFPFVYLIYILIRGHISGHYPYPFVDVTKLGYEQVLFNSFVLLLVFLGFGLLYILIGRQMSKSQKTIPST